MIKKTLLFIGCIVMSLAILVVLLGNIQFIKDIHEYYRIEDSIEAENIIKEQFYNKVEKICFEYNLGENQVLIEKFDKFLEDKKISKEHLLNYISRLETYNGIKYKNYLTEKYLLEDSFNKEQISEKEFETKQNNLLTNYENSKNSLIDYFNSEEKMIFENSKEEIDELFKLIENC